MVEYKWVYKVLHGHPPPTQKGEKAGAFILPDCCTAPTVDNETRAFARQSRQQGVGVGIGDLMQLVALLLAHETLGVRQFPYPAGRFLAAIRRRLHRNVVSYA